MRYFLLFFTLVLQFNVSGYNAQNSVWERELNSYGRVRTETGNANFMPFRYQGQQFDEETGLGYNRFRYIDYETGTYISQDPIGLAGNNPTLYAYVHDPNTWIDPFGLDAFSTWLNKGSSNYSNYNSETYTGITNNFDRRVKEHAGIHGELGKLKNTGNLTKNQARSVEQAIIKNKGLQNLNNQINSINPKRDISDKAVAWGEDWIRKNDKKLAKELGLKCKS